MNLIDRFEIPYNFREDFFECMYSFKTYIKIVFVQALPKHSHNTRYNFDTVLETVPGEWNQYKLHIYKLIAKGYKVAVLFQQERYDDNHVIDQYIEELGIHAIITSSDYLAAYCKQKYPNILTIASICKALTLQDYYSNDMTMYDNAVLDFPFERGLEAIKKLPKKLQYHMIVNNYNCVYDCKMRLGHWEHAFKYKIIERYCNALQAFAEKDYEKAKDILDRYMLFYHNDLQYFDPYIDTFKLQGREDSSIKIMSDLASLVLDIDDRKHDIDYFNDALNNGVIMLEV